MSSPLSPNLSLTFDIAAAATLAATRSYLGVMGLVHDTVPIPNYFNKKYIGEEPQFPAFDKALARAVHYMSAVPEYFWNGIKVSDKKLVRDYNLRPLEAYAGLFMAHPMHDLVFMRKSPDAAQRAFGVNDIVRDRRSHILHYGCKRGGNKPPRAERETAEASHYLDCILTHVMTTNLPPIKIDRLQRAIIQNKTDMAVMTTRFVDLAYVALDLKPNA